MDDEELQELYTWIDEIPLTRPKKNLTRDFSDGVMMAEVVKHFLPKFVELHNYQPASSSKQKMSNWRTLNQKVFKKINLQVPENVIKGVCSCKPGVVEVVLSNLRIKIEQYIAAKNAPPPEPMGYEELDMDEWEDHHHPPGPSRVLGASHKRSPRQQHMPIAQVRGPRQIPGKHGMTPRQAQQLLNEKDQTIMDYQETVDMLETKVQKLEQLVQLKDKRITELSRKLVRGKK